MCRNAYRVSYIDPARRPTPNDSGVAYSPNEPLATLLALVQERRLTAIDFGLFAACGAVGCTSTHLTVVPLDVVKTRLQTDPGRYAGLAEGVTTIAKEVGDQKGEDGNGDDFRLSATVGFYRRRIGVCAVCYG